MIVCRCAGVRKNPPAAPHLHNQDLLKYSAEASCRCAHSQCYLIQAIISERSLFLLTFCLWLALFLLSASASPDSSPASLPLTYLQKSAAHSQALPLCCRATLTQKPQETSPGRRPSAPHQFSAINTLNWFSGSVLTSENHACVWF